MASPTRARIGKTGSAKPVVKSSRRNALRKIANILEGHMSEMGLTEQEKNAKTAELVAFVSDVASSKLALHSKHSKQLRNASLHA